MSSLAVSPGSSGYPRLAPGTPNPFLFSVGDRDLDLYPVLRDGANMHHIRASIARYTGDDLKGYPAIYHRLRRFLKRLETDGYLISEKGVLALGLGERACTWWRPTHDGVYLIGQVQNSNLCKSGPRDPDIIEGDTLLGQVSRGPFCTRYPHEDPDTPAEEIPRWVRFPKRSSLTRLKAASLLCQVRNEYNPDTGRRLFERIPTDQVNDHGEPISVVNPLLQAKLAEVRDYYDYYLEEIADKTIVLVNKDAANPTEEDFKTLPYRTRFNDFSRSARALDRYEAAWTEAEQYYDSAVFLTLTTDPKMHATLWRANRHMAVAWNRYTSLLDKRARDAFITDLKSTRGAILRKDGYSPDEVETILKSDDFEAYIEEEMEGRSFRPKYVAVNEFMQNGLIHMHIIIFGRSWLDHREQISEDWERCGQGSIVKAIGIHRNPRTGVWEWRGQRPDDAQNDESPRDYLKKYLNKAIFDRRGFELYWAHNKPFMSSSRRMDPARLTAEEEVEIWYQRMCEQKAAEENPSYWRYAFCCPADDIPTWMGWYDRKNRDQRPPVLLENLTGTASAPPPLLTANERRIKSLKRAGLLTFRTALELQRSTAAERSEPAINPDTGRPWSLADLL